MNIAPSLPWLNPELPGAGAGVSDEPANPLDYSHPRKTDISNATRINVSEIYNRT